MSKTERQERRSTSLTEKIKGRQALYYTDFTGLNVKRMTELRRRLRDAGVEYVVIKNTLALRAVAGTASARWRAARGPDRPRRRGRGPGRRRQGADRLREGERPEPAMKGGLFDGKPIDAAQVKRLAELPSREQLLAELAGYMQAPMAAVRRRDERPAVSDGRRARGASRAA